MSKGAGVIERRVADLFAGTRDRALSVDEIADHAYQLRGRPATREQRLSATRAAHRLLRRVSEMVDEAKRLNEQARANVTATLGREPGTDDEEYVTLLDADPAQVEASRLWNEARRIGLWNRIVGADKRGQYLIETDQWCATMVERRLWFHPPDVPVRVWAVSIQRGGVIWLEAELIQITKRNVIVRYAGVTARLDRERLWYSWSWWRRVMFVSSRTGRIAALLDELWQQRYASSGSAPPAMQMSLAEAMERLGVAVDYTLEEVIAAFRKAVKLAHPDQGGTAEMFCRLLEARDRLLAAIGTSAPEPKMPAYAPAGT